MFIISQPLPFTHARPTSHPRQQNLIHKPPTACNNTNNKLPPNFPKFPNDDNSNNNDSQNSLPPPFPNPFNPSSRPFFSSPFFLPPAKVTPSQRLAIEINHLKDKENLEPVREIVEVVQSEVGDVRLFAEVVQVVVKRQRVWLRPLVIVEGDWKEVYDVRGKDMLVGVGVVRKIEELERVRVRLGAFGDVEEHKGNEDALMKFLNRLKGM